MRYNKKCTKSNNITNENRQTASSIKICDTTPGFPHGVVHRFLSMQLCSVQYQNKEIDE